MSALMIYLKDGRVFTVIVADDKFYFPGDAGGGWYDVEGHDGAKLSVRNADIDRVYLSPPLTQSFSCPRTSITLSD